MIRPRPSPDRRASLVVRPSCETVGRGALDEMHELVNPVLQVAGQQVIRIVDVGGESHRAVRLRLGIAPARAESSRVQIVLDATFQRNPTQAQTEQTLVLVIGRALGTITSSEGVNCFRH